MGSLVLTSFLLHLIWTQVLDSLKYSGPIKEADQVDLAKQNIRDPDLCFLFGAIELTRPYITYMDLSYNAITGYSK